MRLYTDATLETAKNNALELVKKVVNLTPTDDFTSEDIDMVRSYLIDYADECRYIQTARKMDTRVSLLNWKDIV